MEELDILEKIQSVDAENIIVNLFVSDSAVMLGDHNDNVKIENFQSNCNAEEEKEIIRIYQKLDVRHKNKFMTQVFEFEDMFDDRDEG